MAQIRLKRLATPLTVFACWLALSIVSTGECRKAQEGDVPHGANQLIELKEQPVKRLSGTVLVGFGNSDPAGNVVVEVYRHEGNLDFQKTVQQKRVVACVTGPDGRFSFLELKPGRYLLRVGVREPAGINETYVPVILRSAWKGFKGRSIRVVLQLGT
jgi:hypothetical protein